MKKKRYLFLFITIVLIFTIAFQVTSIGGVTNKGSDKNINFNTITQQEYSIKKIEKYEKNLVYNISYPIFSNQNLNKIVENYIKNLALDFRNSFDGVDINNQKFVFNLSTEIGSLNQIIFLKFDIEKNCKEYPNPIKYTKTLIIDTKDYNQMLPQDFFNKNYRDLFYQEAKKYFLNTYGLVITKESENYNDIKSTEENYSKVFFKDNNMQVYIYDYKKQNEIYINVDKSLFTPYLKKEYLEYNITTETSITTEATTQATSSETTTITTTQKQTTQTTTISSRKIDKNKPMIALTFDDGPNGKNTSKILDILQKNNSVATFFVVGRRLEVDKEIIKRMNNMGCQIGNHTANHKDLTKLSPKEINSELWLVNKKIKEIIGKQPTVVRAPYGAINNTVKTAAPYPFIMWNIDTRDWKTRNAKAIEKEVIGKVKDGDIILMHDLYDSTAAACEIIIPALVKQGFQFVTVEELLKYKGIEMKPGVKYFNGRKS